MSSVQANLQLAISANAAVRGIISKSTEDTKPKLQEASDHLEELIDNLEADLLNNTKISPKLAVSSSVADNEAVATAQWAHIQELTELLRQKEAAMQQAATAHQGYIIQLCAAHNETLRLLRQS